MGTRGQEGNVRRLSGSEHGISAGTRLAMRVFLSSLTGSSFSENFHNDVRVCSPILC